MKETISAGNVFLCSGTLTSRAELETLERTTAPAKESRPKMKFRKNKFAVFWKNNSEKNLNGKKSNFKFQNRGYFRKKNVPQIC